MDRLGCGFGQGPEQHAVLRIGPLADGEDQVLTVVADRRVCPPVLVLGILPDEAVFALGSSQPMVEDLLMEIGPLQILAGLWFWKTAVEEAFAVGSPLGPENLIHFRWSGRSFPVDTSRTFHSFQSEPAAAIP